MADPLNVLAPNWLGDSLANRGVDQISANMGLGVDQIQRSANVQSMAQHTQGSNPDQFKDKLRNAKARQFGVTKEEVGF